MTKSMSSAVRSVAVRALAGFVALAVAGLGAASASHAEDAVHSATVERAFADVRTDLQNAIINQGLRIDYNGRVGEMLQRTGADVGSTVEIYKQAEYFTFCSSRLSRAMMEADPLNMGLCPYVMFVFESALKPGHVTVGYRMIPIRGNEQSQKALNEINTLLGTILAEATE